MRSMLAAAAVRPGFICTPLTIRLATGSCREPGRPCSENEICRNARPHAMPAPQLSRQAQDMHLSAGLTASLRALVPQAGHTPLICQYQDPFTELNSKNA